MNQPKHPTIPMSAPAKKSSQIESIGHDPATNTLAVKFHRGGLYHYADVTPEKFHAFRNAESLGKHLGQHIKGKHPFVKLDQ